MKLLLKLVDIGRLAVLMTSWVPLRIVLWKREVEELCWLTEKVKFVSAAVKVLNFSVVRT